MTEYMCLPLDSEEAMCMEKYHHGALTFCMKPKGHNGDRHAYDLGFRLGAWGYVDEEVEDD